MVSGETKREEEMINSMDSEAAVETQSLRLGDWVTLTRLHEGMRRREKW